MGCSAIAFPADAGVLRRETFALNFGDWQAYGNRRISLSDESYFSDSCSPLTCELWKKVCAGAVKKITHNTFSLNAGAVL